MTGSVRLRVTLVATLAVAVVLGTASAGLVLSQHRALTDSLEESLAQQADEIAATLRAGTFPEVLQVAGDDDALAQVVDESGQVLVATAGADDDPPVAPSLHGGGDVVAVSKVHGLPSDPATFLVVSRRTEGPDGPLTIHVASPLDDIVESTSTLARSLTFGVPLVVVLLAALVWWLVGRTLRPVEAIRSEVSEIGGTDLHRRVPAPTSGDEIAELATTMNAMLDRVEQASERQQCFVADASHELRSPLTRMRTELEVDLAHPSGADLAATHRSVLEEVGGLQDLVDDLLLLARSDASAPIASGPIDLDELVLDEAHRLVPRPEVEVDVDDVVTVRIVGDASQVGRAVRNVLENAARHATRRVVVRLAAEGGDAVLVVEDDGTGIPPGREEEVFERFTRLDASRTAGDGGTGLGLPIAREVVTRHGGAIVVEAGASGGARFVIRLPLAATDLT